ncbi:fumarate hydratase [Mucilaginibacter sp. HMF5004]|uniref:fumarate hydratase n=1 Tax=Mucilaginibacter rivuli TaxID=2857527 RepID=UPI001C5CEF7B|nr:fumarate hydratase [Mucilaginibacter rivuli]MBW4888128.1 fumarate hydratase [Mucilaginibacter rivuli]
MQKPFNFQLLTFNLKRASCLLLLASCLFSCSFNPPLQGNGVKALQGEWKQDTIGNSKQLVNYTLYNFRFSCDSVFIRMENFSKVNYGTDTCMNKGHWLEYAGATYDQKESKLHVKGFYCDANYHLKNPGGCFNSGVYEDTFSLTMKDDSVLELLPVSSTVPIKLKLTKRTTCTPKPL